MAFKDLRSWAVAGLQLPIAGTVYSVPPVSAELGPQLQAFMSLGISIATEQGPDGQSVELLSDLAEKDLYRQVLSDEVYDAMVADGVPWTVLKCAAMTVIIDATVDRPSAEKYWESQGKPRRRKSTGQQDRSGTATPTSTVSTAGTRARKKRKRARPGP